MPDEPDFYCDEAIPHPERLRVVHDSAEVLAFHHTEPFWETHLVVVPKRHIRSLTTVRAADAQQIRALLEVVQQIARAVEDEYGEAVVLTNTGAAQSNLHLHVHVHRGARLR